MTTGHTVTSNLKAMLTGWEDLESDGTAHVAPPPDGVPVPVLVKGNR
jgi:hypothetical protein